MSTWLTLEASIIKKFADQVRIRLISQKINGISRILQNYLNILMAPSF